MRTEIKSLIHSSDELRRNVNEIDFFRGVLANEFVYVFLGTFRPGAVTVGKYVMTSSIPVVCCSVMIFRLAVNAAPLSVGIVVMHPYDNFYQGGAFAMRRRRSLIRPPVGTQSG